MKLFTDPTLRLTPSWADAKRTQLVRDGYGLIAFRLALWVGGKEVDHMAVVSGQAYNQALMTCTERQPGCAAPVGEGVYALGDPDATRRINWASGVVGNYGASFRAGLGPIWTGIHATAEYPCSTSDFGFHADWNADEGMPGTLGCTGLPTPGKSLVALKQYASWQAQYDVSRYVVDHGMGTVPRPSATVDGKATPVEVLPVKHWTKLFANGGKIAALRDGVEQQALTVRLDYHHDKLGVAVNGVQLPADQVASLQLVLSTQQQ